MAQINGLILAAGYSTRLYPLTLNTPKPLLEVGSKLMVERILSKMNEMTELGTIYIVTNAKFVTHFNDWLALYREAHAGAKEIVIVNDGTESNDTRLGPVGDINFVLQQYTVETDLLVVAGDNIFEVNLSEIVKVKNQHNASVLAVYDFNDIERVRNKFGVTLCNHDGKITAFEEKPAEPKSTLAATALYLLKQDHLPYIIDLYKRPHEGELNAGEMIIELLRQGADVYSYPLDEWFDIGSKEDLEKAAIHYS